MDIVFSVIGMLALVWLIGVGWEWREGWRYAQSATAPLLPGFGNWAFRSGFKAGGLARCDRDDHEWIEAELINACCRRECECLVPLHECFRCGITDGGLNAEAELIVDQCSLRMAQP